MVSLKFEFKKRPGFRFPTGFERSVIFISLFLFAFLILTIVFFVALQILLCR